jgi:hypothetical protein
MVDNLNTAEPGKTRRRWFQFRLRTMLIGIVLLAPACAYFAHEAQIVRERKAWLETNRRWQEYALMWRFNFNISAANPDKCPSLTRRWLGDKPVTLIVVDPDSEVDLQSASELFPEAVVMHDR